LAERRRPAQRADQLRTEGADRPRRHLVVGEVAEDDVLMAVVVRGRLADLRPFPAEEGDDVGVARIAGDGVALPDRVLGLLPVLRRDGLGVIIDAPEVETRAEAREVAASAGGAPSPARNPGCA
jgi:hypothetical protein